MSEPPDKKEPPPVTVAPCRVSANGKTLLCGGAVEHDEEDAAADAIERSPAAAPFRPLKY